VTVRGYFSLAHGVVDGATFPPAGPVGESPVAAP
jgi:hypothetical protein